LDVVAEQKCVKRIGSAMSKASQKRKAAHGTANEVCHDTLGLHSVSDDSRRKIYNATCRALNKEEHCLEAKPWKQISENVLADVFYPVELPSVHDEGSVTFFMGDVRKSLQTVMDQCPNYRQQVEKVLISHLGLVFDVLLYNDEASGGNILNPNASKKVSLWYYSLVQIGFLFSDCVWMPLCLLQHSNFDQIKGGFAAFAAKVIRELMSQDLDKGFPVTFSYGLGLLRLDLKYMLSDLDSIRGALDAKGSAGIRCCLHCKNAIKRGTNLSEYNSFFQDISNHDLSAFHEQTDADIFAIVDGLVLQAPNLGKTALQKKETACGFNHNPHGLLCDHFGREILPPSSFLLDTMHLYYSNGIASWEVVQMYGAWKEFRLGDLPAFLDLDWKTSLQSSCTPSWRKELGHESMFASSSYKGSASNLMAFVPLFHYFLTRVLACRLRIGDLQKELACFSKLREVLMELRHLQNADCDGPAVDKFQSLQVEHQELLVLAYGKEVVKPKHHCRFHQAVQMKRTGWHVDAFATEKKHRMYKSHIGLHRFDPWCQSDKGTFSQLVLRAIWQHHVPSLKHFEFGTTLQGPTSSEPTIAKILNKSWCKTSCKMVHRGRTLEKDHILLGQHPGIIVLAAETDAGFYILLEELELIEKTHFFSRFQVQSKKKLLALEKAGPSPMWWLKLDVDILLCLH